MEIVRNNVTLQLNRAAVGVEHSQADSSNKQEVERKALHESKQAIEDGQDFVSVSISQAGMQIMKNREQSDLDQLASEEEIEEMKKKMEGLSSQLINGNFSMEDRIRFQTEIKYLSDELVRVNGGGVSFTKADNSDIAKRIQSLTRDISNAAVYHRPVSAFYVVRKQQSAAYTRNKLDIAI